MRAANEADETSVKEYRTQADKPNGNSNQYVKMFNNTSDTHQICNGGKHLCIDAGKLIQANLEDLAYSSRDRTSTQTLKNKNNCCCGETCPTETHEYESLTHWNDHLHSHCKGNLRNATNINRDDSLNYLHHDTRFPDQNGDRNDCNATYLTSYHKNVQQVTGDLNNVYMNRRRINELPLRSHTLSICKYAFFRNRLCILSVLYLMLLLINGIGLALLHVKHVQESNVCLNCDILQRITEKETQDLDINKISDGQCCVNSAKVFSAVLLKGWTNQKDVQRNYKLINKLLTRHRAALHLSGLVSNGHIVWKDVRVKEGNLTYDEHGIQLNTGGTYSLYSNIGFKRGFCHGRRRLGYSVKMKKDHGSTATVASEQRLCFNGSNYEQEFATQTIIKVPMGEKREVFVDIAPNDYEFVLKHYTHTFGIFEI